MNDIVSINERYYDSKYLISDILKESWLEMTPDQRLFLKECEDLGREQAILLEGPFDNLKAKTAGAVGGAKAAVGAIGKAATGQSTGGLKQAFKQGQQDTAAISLVNNKISKLEKIINTLETDLLKLTGLDKEEFSKQYPDSHKFVDNIISNIDAMKAISGKLKTQTQQQPAADNTQA